jgi:hypothetical protein
MATNILPLLLMCAIYPGSKSGDLIKDAKVRYFVGFESGDGLQKVKK